MINHNRALSWRTISRIQHYQKTIRWKHKPKFAIGEAVTVKMNAKSIYGKESGGIWGTLIMGFDKCRKPLRGRQGVIMEIHHDKKYGCSYHVQFGNKTGKGFGRRVLMDEQWLRKQTNREIHEWFIIDMITLRLREGDY